MITIKNKKTNLNRKAFLAACMACVLGAALCVPRIYAQPSNTENNDAAAANQQHKVFTAEVSDQNKQTAAKVETKDAPQTNDDNSKAGQPNKQALENSRLASAPSKDNQNTRAAVNSDSRSGAAQYVDQNEVNKWGTNIVAYIAYIQDETVDEKAHKTLVIESKDKNAGSLNATGYKRIAAYLKNDPEITCVNFPIPINNNKHVAVPNEMPGLFEGCTHLERVDLSGLSLENCTDSSAMFKDCKNLRYLGLGDEFNTSNVTTMKSMFENCHSLLTLNFPQNFNTSKVTTMESMFDGCVSLCNISFVGGEEGADASAGFNTSQVTNMHAMFKNCRHIGRTHEVGGGADAGTRLQTFTLPKKFTVENCTDLSEMFYCDNHTAIEYDKHGNHEGQQELKHTSWLKEIVDCDGNAFEFNAPKAITIKDMFYGLESLGGHTKDKPAGKLPIVKTSDQLTDCSGMFKNCANIGLKVGETSASVDVSNMVTQNVTDFSSMFEGCKNLVKVKGFNQINSSNAKNFSSMFKDCINLETFSGEYGPGSNFFTNKVEDMSSMFEGCFALKDANTHWFSGEKLTNMSKMFKGCGNLGKVDLVSLTAPKLELMDETFMNTSLANEIILTNLNPENLKSMNRVFAGTWGLDRLDISKLKNDNVADENKQDMFKHYVFEGKIAPIDIDDWIKLGKDFSFKTNPQKDDLPFYVNRYVTKEDRVLNRWEDKPIACNRYSDNKDLDKNFSSMKGDDIAGTWKPARVLVVKDMIAEANGGYKEHYFVSPKDTADTQLGTDTKIVANIDIQKKANKPGTDDNLTYPCHENFSVDQNNKWRNNFEYDKFDDPTNDDAAQKVLYAAPNWKCDVQVLDSDNTKLASFPLFYFWPVSYWPTWAQGAVPTNVLNYQFALEEKGQPGVPVHPGKTFKGWKIVGHGDTVYQWSDQMPKISDLVKPDGKPEKIILQAVYEEIPLPPATGADVGNVALAVLLATSVIAAGGYTACRKFFARR